MNAEAQHEPPRYTVGEVAKVARVTVRTLHHYDAIGLLRPSARSASEYRLYTHGDLERLAQIRCYRELEFGLDQIAEILDDPSVDVLEHLRRQRVLLGDRLDRLHQIVANVEKTMEARRMGISLTPDEIFEVFGEEDPTQHAEEAEQRWGDTDAWKQSQRRVGKYSKDDWIAIKAEAADIEQRFAAAMTAGTPADSDAAMDLAEAHRTHIDTNFYDCPVQMHKGLGEMYITDSRFAAHYNDIAPNLAQYVRDAIHANADRPAAP